MTEPQPTTPRTDYEAQVLAHLDAQTKALRNTSTNTGILAGALLLAIAVAIIIAIV